MESIAPYQYQDYFLTTPDLIWAGTEKKLGENKQSILLKIKKNTYQVKDLPQSENQWWPSKLDIGRVKR